MLIQLLTYTKRKTHQATNLSYKLFGEKTLLVYPTTDILFVSNIFLKTIYARTPHTCHVSKQLF